MVRKLLLTLLLLAFVAPALPAHMASAQSEGEGDDAIQEIVFEDYLLDTVDYTLPNGLRVILAQDHSAPVVAVDIWYRTGGANDPENRSGFAHLFEHIMFEGSANVPGGTWDPLLESIGAIHNAYTAIDQTGYWEVAPANELPRILWMESDRMAALDVTEEAFINQRSVVIQEYNQRYANSPYGKANLRLFTRPFQGYAPYERAPIGSIEDLNAATFDEVKAFHDQYYKPNNATLVIVGDIDIEQTQALVQAYFGDIPGGEPQPSIVDRYPPPDEFPAVDTDERGCLVGSREVLIDPQVQIPRIGFSFVGPRRGDPDYYAFSLLATILSGGDSSRFEQNIVQQGEGVAAFLGFNPYVGATVSYVLGYANLGDDPETLLSVIHEEIDAVRENGVTEQELARAKRQELVWSLASFRESVYSTAEWIQDAVLTFGDPDAIGPEFAQYEAVTLEDVQRVAQQYLCDTPMHYQIVLNQGEEVLAEHPGELVAPVDAEPRNNASPELVVPEEVIAALPEGTVSRTSVPAPLGELTTNMPPFQTFQLDNGLDVIFVEQHEVPKLQLQLVVGGSDTSVAPEKQGVANILATLLTKGTLTRSAAQIAEEIEAAGGSVSANAALEWTTISVDALTTDTRLAFNLISDIARRATFPQRELDIAVDQMLTLLEQDRVNPSSMANRQFARIAFGNHPYGYIETPETVGSLTRDDMREFYNTFFKPNNALLIIVGDLTAEEARAEAERAFQYWRSGDVPDFLDYPEADSGDSSVIYLVDRPESEQATIQVGNLAIDARSPDRYALEVLNSVLGGGSAARLYTRLREELGYTYGVYSYFARPNDRATFRVLGDFNQEYTAESLQEILAELTRIREEPISEEELEGAKGRINGNFALALEDLNSFAGQLAIRHLTGIPIEELDEYLDHINAVTIEDVQAVANAHIDIENPIIVVVGNADVVLPQLETLGKEVVVVDADGNPID